MFTCPECATTRNTIISLRSHLKITHNMNKEEYEDIIKQQQEDKTVIQEVKHQLNENQQLITKLIKKYVDEDEEYQQANRIVNDHKKLQEKLKKLFEEENIDNFVVNEDGYNVILGFKKSIYHRIDVDALPENIRETYQKEVITRREQLCINSKPSN